jgi:hypothetical protein
MGCIERAADRGGHSIYASLIYIDPNGTIRSVHRKLMPTYEERLTWSPGDGHGLRVHSIGPFTLGGLNCWENWMPLARAALYGQGEDLHVAIWPGGHTQYKSNHPIHCPGGPLVCYFSIWLHAEDRFPAGHTSSGNHIERMSRHFSQWWIMYCWP